ncbi:MAG: hypothetical protein IJS78_05040 [Clostridia bacterium]|nr:hypothetical protein [Clostridia bacterium]
MYKREIKRERPAGISDEEWEIAQYGLPPKYDGSRFRRPLPEDGPSPEYPEPPVRGDEETDLYPVPAPRRPDKGGVERLLEGLGERFGTEEILIVALILILAGSGGDGCDDPQDVVLLLALLLIVGR